MGANEDVLDLEEMEEEEVESMARRMGHSSQEDFKGDPGKWIPAKEFVERALNELPLARSNLRTQNRRLGELEKKIERQTEVLEKFNKHHQKSLQETASREYQRGLEEARDRMKQAVEEGDVDGAQAAWDDAEKLRKESEGAGDKKTGEVEPDKDAVVAEAVKVRDAWMEENPWYKENRIMKKFAFESGEMLSKTEPNLTASEQLAAVREMVEEQFPDYFSNPNRKRASAVEGASHKRVDDKGGGRKKTYNDLPSEAKAMCDDFVKEIPGYKAQTYVDEYFSRS